MRGLEAATIAFLAPGDEAGDRAHNQQGEATSIVRTDGRAGRRAAKWFSYDLPLAGGTASTIVVTYNRDNRRARSFEVLVDGERIAEERIAFDSESRFYDREYALPPALVQGKSKITIRFQARRRQRDCPRRRPPPDSHRREEAQTRADQDPRHQLSPAARARSSAPVRTATSPTARATD